MVPGVCCFRFLPASSLAHDLMQKVKQALFGITIGSVRFVKVCLTTTLIALYGLGMIEADEGAHVWARLAGLRGKDCPVIHPEVKANVVSPIGGLLFKVALLVVLLEIGDEIGDGERAVALLVSVHAPPDTAFVVFGKGGTLDVQERMDPLFAGCHKASILSA